MNDIKAIIFDLDGTLLDTEPIELACWNHALEPYDVVISDDEYLQYCGHLGPDVEKMIASNHGLNIKDGSVYIKRKEYVNQWLKDKPISLMPYARDLLKYCKNEGVIMGIATSSVREMLDLKLKRTSISHFFDATLSRSEVSHAKPDPEIYIKAVEELGLEPQNCIVIEDTQPGVEAGSAAGMKCFAVPHLYSKKQDFSSAYRIFKSHKEIINYLIKQK